MIKTIFYPSIAMNVLRLQMTDVEAAIYDSMAVEEKVNFILNNLDDEEKQQTYPDLISAMIRIPSKYSIDFTPGICRICGCTAFDACNHPEYGACWWEDESQTVCSHCANPEIANDPATKHPSKVKQAIF